MNEQDIKVIYFGDIMLPSQYIVPPLPPGTQLRKKPFMVRLRERLRRWLGVTEIETLREQIDDLQAEMRAADACDDMHIEQIADLAARVSRVDRNESMNARRMEVVANMALQASQTTGGVWKTMDGTVLAIRQMSDNHLQQALDHLIERGKSGSDTARLMRREIQRRHTDDVWHERVNKTSPRKLLTRVSSVLRQAQLRIEALERRTGGQLSADELIDSSERAHRISLLSSMAKTKDRKPAKKARRKS